MGPELTARPAANNNGEHVALIVGRLMMKKFIYLAGPAALLALAACQSEKADNVEDAAENRADQLDEMADNATSEAQEEALENKADRVEEQGEEAANKIDDNGEIAPSETHMGDTQ
ncbi:uncharacterized protein PY1_contig-06-192 [Novosphingobium sp. PY1]|nr:uncharacterized protein PY1_contig-06-192 [Novosphingobium sp. PY1]